MGVYILKAVAHNIQEDSGANQTNAWIVANNGRTEVGKDTEYTLIFTNIENPIPAIIQAIGDKTTIILTIDAVKYKFVTKNKIRNTAIFVGVFLTNWNTPGIRKRTIASNVNKKTLCRVAI